MDSSVKLDFGLSPDNLSDESKASWPYPFGLIYSVTLSRDGLETSMLVRNEGEEAFEFQFLLHTYFKINVGFLYFHRLPAPPKFSMNGVLTRY